MGRGTEVEHQLERSGQFHSLELQQGDLLLFNRRLGGQYSLLCALHSTGFYAVHRGGANTSAARRLALILQYVWLWGVGQEAAPGPRVAAVLLAGDREEEEEGEDEKLLLLRVDPPYPRDTSTGT